MIVPQDRPPRTTTTLQRLLLAFRAPALDALAHLGTAADRRQTAVAADALHDRTLARLIYVAAVGAEEAALAGCGCAVRFDRLLRLGRDAQRADLAEDGQHDAAFTEVERGAKRIRPIAAHADRLLTGRRGS